MNRTTLPVAVIGAGPVGLAAAAHLISKGETPIIFEAGATVGAHILKWGHVRLFSPWRYNIDAVAGAMLEAAGWSTPPADDFPTGRELVEHYLAPLAALPPNKSAPGATGLQPPVEEARGGARRTRTINLGAARTHRTVA